ncbi:MAG TPA: DegQ family serine endoprotease [Candidatus Binataceae bacterium]|nr:DegQ family serine endoprotease [Candidatus Binataceae bacterium]
MFKKIGAVSIGVIIGLVVAFARAGAFQLWGSDKPDSQSSPPAQSAQTEPQPAGNQAVPAPVPAPANQPEPNEKAGVITSFAPLVKRVMPTVVNVAVVQDVKVGSFGQGGDEGGPEEGGPEAGPEDMPPGMPGGGGGGGGGDPFEQFRRFFGQIPRDYKQHGLGSGVIVSPDGYILTNNHVVGGAEEIHVTLMDKREFTAKVIGKDAKTDLALIKVDTKDPLPVAELGNSDAMDVGDWVVAIGNPFGFTLTTTAGIVSAKGRMLGGNYDDFIQTDASINPGNSGGPLFNTSGQVIGINTAIYSRSGMNAGIGFAIPANLAKHVMDQLKAHGRVVRGWLGVEIQEVTPDLAQSFGLAKPEGALVASVEKDGPAAKSGLERGDVVLKFDGKDVHDEHELPVLVADTAINKTVPIDVVRNGKHMTLQVTVGELKEAAVQTAKAEEPGTNWGMQVGDITPEIASQFHLQADKGVVVRHVAPDSPAADAGVQPGDLILEVDRRKVATVNDFLAKAKEDKASGKSALLLVLRGGTSYYMVIKSGSGKG